jgi:hypothetical protein
VYKQLPPAQVEGVVQAILADGAALRPGTTPATGAEARPARLLGGARTDPNLPPFSSDDTLADPSFPPGLGWRQFDDALPTRDDGLATIVEEPDEVDAGAAADPLQSARPEGANSAAGEDTHSDKGRGARVNTGWDTLPEFVMVQGEDRRVLPAYVAHNGALLGVAAIFDVGGVQELRRLIEARLDPTDSGGGMGRQLDAMLTIDSFRGAMPAMLAGGKLFSLADQGRRVNVLVHAELNHPRHLEDASSVRVDNTSQMWEQQHGGDRHNRARIDTATGTVLFGRRT